MQYAGIPYKFPVIWASGPGAILTNPIPTTSQTQGHASFPDGFPPINSVQIAAGGIPPWGVDENGIMNAVTAWEQWIQAGGPIAYDATFQAEIGGYPRGAIVDSAAYTGLQWLSTADNNLTNPDAGGAGWVAWPLVLYAHDTGAANAMAVQLQLPLAAIPIGTVLWVNPLHPNTVSAPTLNINGVAPVAVTTALGGGLASGAIAQGIPAQIMVGDGRALWLLNAQAGSPAASPTHGAQSFRTPGVYNFTIPASTLTFWGWGAGGGAGGGYVDLGGSAGSGGGSGGRGFVVLNNFPIGGTIQVTIGAGGPGGGGGGDGNPGGLTLVTYLGSPILQENPGSGGSGGQRGNPGQFGGAPGTSVYGTDNVTGQYGSPDYQTGGSAPGGGLGGVANNFGAPYPASGPGGGGAASYNSTTPGGDGAPGGVLITW